MRRGTELRATNAAPIRGWESSRENPRNWRPLENHVVHVGPLTIDFDSRIVRRGGTPVHLSRLEFDLLVLLSSPAGMLVAREELLDRLWPDRSLADTRTLDTHVRRLRMKLEADPSHPRYLVTVRGVGFRIDP